MKTVFLFVAIALCLSSLLVAEPIFPFPIIGGLVGGSSGDPNLNIKLYSEDLPFHPEDDQESVIMLNTDGNSYICYLPKVEEAESRKAAIQVNVSSTVVESSAKSVESKTPDELLEELEGTCFTKIEDWWSYEFCYKKKIRQLHFEDDKVVQEFILGEFDNQATAAFDQNLPDISTLKYHPHQYKNGTICDLTNQPRETEVRFVCSEPGAMIGSVTQLTPCKYAVTIRSPMLCRHPLFQGERPDSNTIHCNLFHKKAKRI